MLIDLSCPAEVFEAALPTEEVPAVSLSMYNLSDRVIASVEVTLKLLGGSGAEKERVVFRGRALNGRPHSTFRMNIPCTPNAAARTADVTVDKVWFSDNDCWRRELSSSVEYIPNNLPVSTALTNLQYAAGETAVGFPSQQDGLWVCVCGRPNPDGETACARCRREKQMIFARFNRETVEAQVAQREKQLDLATRNIREDTARLQHLREEEYNLAKARKTRRIRLGLCILLCFLAAALAAGVAVPGLRMLSADRAMARGDWTGAVRTLEKLGDFPGAKAKIETCVWQEAKALSDAAKTREELSAASAALRKVTGRPESLTLAEEADLRRAKLALADGDPEAAREALENLSEEDPRRTALETECLYAEAKAQMARGEYEDAREAFLLLEDSFDDAADLAAECVLIPARALMDDGKYDDALTELNRIPDDAGAAAAMQECHYRIAGEAEALGNLETAAAEYRLAGNYGDAQKKTRDTVYALAEQTLTAGDTAAAQTLYASLAEDTPAKARWRECTLILAREAMGRKEYETAAELLGALPADYDNAAELLKESAYFSGITASKQKDWEKAVLRLEQAGDYEDAPSRLTTALEKLIRRKLDEGNGAAALELLPKITGSRKYADYLQEAQYLDALAQKGSGADPGALAEKFEAAGNYLDAKTQAKEQRYLQGEQADAEGETLAAARAYAKASGYQDADERAAARYDLYYGEAAEAAREASKQKDYAKVQALLEPLDRSELPAKYRDLDKLYETACLKVQEAAEKTAEDGE